MIYDFAHDYRELSSKLLGASREQFFDSSFPHLADILEELDANVSGMLDRKILEGTESVCEESSGIRGMYDGGFVIISTT